MVRLFDRLSLGILLVLLAGCTSNKISNMTPKVLHRTPDGLYTFEARWDTNQRAFLDDTMKPFVVVERDFHSMQRVALTTNRWEAVVPVPADKRFLNYRFKFDYLVNGFGKKHPDSRMSPTYQVEIVE